jgi:hypothetical protein
MPFFLLQDTSEISLWYNQKSLIESLNTISRQTLSIWVFQQDGMGDDWSTHYGLLKKMEEEIEKG